jgi:hypothetical protein
MGFKLQESSTVATAMGPISVPLDLAKLNLAFRAQQEDNKKAQATLKRLARDDKRAKEEKEGKSTSASADSKKKKRDATKDTLSKAKAE